MGTLLVVMVSNTASLNGRWIASPAVEPHMSGAPNPVAS